MTFISDSHCFFVLVPGSARHIRGSLDSGSFAEMKCRQSTQAFYAEAGAVEGSRESATITEISRNRVIACPPRRSLASR